MNAPPPLPAEVLERVRDLLARASEAGDLTEPASFTLATADADGRPSSRTLLLKDVNENGFVFYTNLRSRKAKQLQENPWAAMTFFWQSQFEQIQVEGPVEPVSDEEADEYWATRPRESQVGAWASDQSAPLADRATLETRVREFTDKFEGEPVPRPAHWSGYRLRPSCLEFWAARDFRLHDRETWTAKGDTWSQGLLFP
ncbi:MAG: pyridoxine/pyridoxamine 5'-phosphate oxidase [Gemmatimonadota bacterium]|nr:MAG: pyridoxine/pyridoxamine 5'-phosphate oxidase [Gemmatimonadota bacterium]